MTSARSRPLRVLVVGGGIGGLAAAIALVRAGHEVEVFERTPALGEVGAGLSLWTNALRALDALGVLPRLRAQAMADVVGAIRTWDGRTISHVPLEPLRRELGQMCLIVHRAELQTTLVEALGAQRIRLGASCVAVEQDASAVRACFAGGDTAEGDVLIGADGLHSVVRATLHGASPPRYAGYTAWRGVVPFEQGRLLIGESWGRGARFGQLPMTGGRVYWFGVENAPEGARAPEGEKAHLLHLFREWHSPIGALIEATDESAILRNDICDRPPLAVWGRGRITLLGDAAHPMTPNLGQGACQALEDAVALGAALTGCGRPAQGLRAYESRRTARANAILVQSRRLGALAQWQNRWAVAFRNAVLARVPASVQQRQMLGLLRG